MIKIIKTDGKTEFELIKALKEREKLVGLDVESAVKEIIFDIKQRGDNALLEYTQKFDRVDKIIRLFRPDFEAGFNRCDDLLKSSLAAAAKNIEEFHRLQMPKDIVFKKGSSEIGQLVKGLSRVAIYVPGGRAAYPSTVLMNAIPAAIAGVQEIVILSPAVMGISDAILAAAYICNASEMILVGGAQAVAAAAYGTQTIAPVDKIVGPGNIYVSTAKKLVYGICDIDMIAGPSEITIIADRFANPAYIAADLMSQAEHDPLASSVLLTDSFDIALKTVEEINTQIAGLGRKDTIKKSFEDCGAIIVCKDLDEMIDLSNKIAPEHLELMIQQPKTALLRIKNAGSVFLGQYSPEPLGDYFAGVNHVLPTNGTARFYSPLSVDSFVKRIQFVNYSKADLVDSAAKIECLAGHEGFSAHANSITVRTKNGL